MLELSMTIATMARVYITISAAQTAIDSVMLQLEGQMTGGNSADPAPTDGPSPEVNHCLNNLLNYLMKEEIDMPNHFFIPGDKKMTIVLLVYEEDAQKIIDWFQKVLADNTDPPSEDT